MVGKRGAGNNLAYYAVPGNIGAVSAFRTQATRHWYKALRRRSQRTRVNWAWMNRLAARWIPPAKILRPYPEVRFAASDERVEDLREAIRVATRRRHRCVMAAPRVIHCLNNCAAGRESSRVCRPSL